MPGKKSRSIRLNLKKLLKARKMTLVELCRRTGLNRAALHVQFTGRAKRVDYATLAKVKDALGVEWDELLV